MQFHEYWNRVKDDPGVQPEEAAKLHYLALWVTKVSKKYTVYSEYYADFEHYNWEAYRYLRGLVWLIRDTNSTRALLNNVDPVDSPDDVDDDTLYEQLEIAEDEHFARGFMDMVHALRKRYDNFEEVPI